MKDYFIIEPCTTSGGFEIKLKDRKIDLKKAEDAFSKLGEVIATTPVVLLAKIEDFAISVYGSGRMLIKSEKKLTHKKVEELAGKIVSKLEENDSI